MLFGKKSVIIFVDFVLFGVCAMEKFGLTPAQRNIDDMQRFYSGTAISVLCGAVIFEEKLEPKLLFRAARLVIRRQEALRLRFCTETAGRCSMSRPRAARISLLPNSRTKMRSVPTVSHRQGCPFRVAVRCSE